jgi:hypothetical protein
MRSSQWMILGTMFILLQGWLIKLDTMYTDSCRLIDKFVQPMLSEIMTCVKARMLEPLIWVLLPLGITFFVCGGIEIYHEMKNKKLKT